MSLSLRQKSKEIFFLLFLDYSYHRDNTPCFAIAWVSHGFYLRSLDDWKSHPLALL